MLTRSKWHCTGGRTASSVTRRTAILGDSETLPGRHLCLSCTGRAESRSVGRTNDPGFPWCGSRGWCAALYRRVLQEHPGGIVFTYIVRPGHLEIAVCQRRSLKRRRNDEVVGQPTSCPAERKATGQPRFDKSGFESDIISVGLNDASSARLWSGYNATQDWQVGFFYTSTGTCSISGTFSLVRNVISTPRRSFSRQTPLSLRLPITSELRAKRRPGWSGEITPFDFDYSSFLFASRTVHTHPKSPIIMICFLSTFFYFDFLALPLFILSSFCKADDECVMNGISGRHDST